MKPVSAWFRLRGNLQGNSISANIYTVLDMSFCDKKIILLLMSDYIVALPVSSQKSNCNIKQFFFEFF
jgi:hypothetical protein